MNINYKNLIASIFFYLVSALGISITVVANIGVSSFNSLNLTLSNISDIPVGTITILINFTFLILCWCLDSKKKVNEYLLMAISLILFGIVINFFVYYFFSGWTIKAYFLRLLFFLVGVVIAGFGTGQVLYFKLLKFPIEHLCLILSELSIKNFSFYRYAIDILCISISLSMTLIFKIPLFIREGTILSLLLLSYVISLSKNSSLI